MIVAIVVGFVLGIIVGLIVVSIAPSDVQTGLATWFKALGDIFVRLIRIVIPLLIFFTIASGIVSIASVRVLGSILIYMLTLYIATSALAAFWGVLGGVLFTPGAGYKLELPKDYTPPKPPSGPDILLSFFSLDFNVLLTVGGATSMIIFAIILGVAVVLLGEQGRGLASSIQTLSRLFIQIIVLVMLYAPVAVFCYAAWLIIVYGPKIVEAYARFVAVQYSFSLFHFIVIYGILVLLGGLNPLTYYRIQLTPFSVAFTTRSSAVTLPVNMEAAKRMGIREELFNVTLPVGATVNMDGTALYQALSALFIAQLFGITLEPAQLLMVIVGAVIGSIATAAIPGGGTVMLAYVLSLAGLPLEGIAIMLAIDPITDAMRTAINVSGDNACTVLLNKLLGQRLTQQPS